MRAPARVVITGFMGAGKTTAARSLARLVGAQAVDLDDLVARREGRTPRRLIDEDGEAAFRDAETRALGAALEGSGPRVVALGGGAWTLARNRAIVAAGGYRSVWLDAPFDLCWCRISLEGDARPLARDREQAHRLYEERRPAYGLADARVAVVAGQSPEQLAAEILVALTAT